MTDITKNSIDGRICEAIAKEDLKEELSRRAQEISGASQVYDSKRAGYDNVGILLDDQNRIQQLYICEIKKTPGAGGIVKLSQVQTRLKKLCKKTHIDHLTIQVSEQQIVDWIFNNKARGGEM